VTDLASIELEGIGSFTVDVTSPIARKRVETFWTKEPYTLDWIRSFEPGSVFWDIGANIGLYSFYAALLGHRVDAFEPYPPNIAEFMATYVRSDDLGELMTLHPWAIGGEQGCYALAIPKMNGAGATTFTMQSPGTTGILVNGITLTEAWLWLRTADYPDYIKIDVDGTEYDVLKGGAEVIKEAISVLVEINANNPSSEGIKDLMSDYGFKQVASHKSPLFPADTNPVSMVQFDKA